MTGRGPLSKGANVDVKREKVQFENFPKDPSEPPSYSEIQQNDSPLQRIIGVRLPKKSASELFDLTISNGRVASIDAHDSHTSRTHHPPGVLDATGRLLAPALCHAHIHLDKCFLLQDPKYADLEIVSGDFNEAMTLTSRAKERFEEDDLLRRGRQLIEESIRFGVTSMRAFVEVDAQVDLKCLGAGLKLRKEFENKCEIQICAFAQLPLFSGDDSGLKIRQLMEEAVRLEGVDALGSTPYVEQDQYKMKMNVRWISGLALRHQKFLDFHMDYNLDESKPAFIWSALDIIKGIRWPDRGGKNITMGHCTRLTCFKKHEWSLLQKETETLPISFVGLPTSDLFMMRAESGVRGTLNVPKMIKEYKLNAAVAVNNVGNAFTPQGDCDPLAVASLGVGLYQTGTKQDAELLYVSHLV